MSNTYVKYLEIENATIESFMSPSSGGQEEVGLILVPSMNF